MIHVLSDGGYEFIGLVTGHDLDSVTVVPSRLENIESSALIVALLPDELTLSRLDAAFEEWQ